MESWLMTVLYTPQLMTFGLYLMKVNWELIEYWFNIYYTNDTLVNSNTDIVVSRNAIQLNYSTLSESIWGQ